MRCAASKMRARVSRLISGWLLMARETVIFETPSARAMSAKVVGMILGNYLPLFSAFAIDASANGAMMA